MVLSADQKVQGPLDFAIVDEIDNILIDEARTPLIISGSTAESIDLYRKFASLAYRKFASLARRFRKDEDFEIDEEAHRLTLTDEGIRKAEAALKVDNLFTPEHQETLHYLENALKALHMFHKEQHYIVKDGRVMIVDEFTGRLMPDRRYSDGLHQALEAKEGLKVQRAPPRGKAGSDLQDTEGEVRGDRRGGRTAAQGGAACPDRDELDREVRIPVEAPEKARSVPPRPQRQVPREGGGDRRRGREARGDHGGDKHGRKGDGHQARGRGRRARRAARHRLPAPRIPPDRQPAEDDLLRIFGGDRIGPLMDRLGMKEGEAIEHNLLTSAIRRAQKRVEGRNFEIRKRLLEFDLVLAKQPRMSGPSSIATFTTCSRRSPKTSSMPTPLQTDPAMPGTSMAWRGSSRRTVRSRHLRSRGWTTPG